ncbi:MAG TPA: sterol desaturase family protein [Pseudomonadota bacterium]|nr:sterol desaturase family protein [Pseudomonadota bacterium]
MPLDLQPPKSLARPADNRAVLQRLVFSRFRKRWELRSRPSTPGQGRDLRRGRKRVRGGPRTQRGLPTPRVPPAPQPPGLVRILSPFWIATAGLDLLFSGLPGGHVGGFAVHGLALVVGFHAWHRALHDPRSGRLFRLHVRHHVMNYPASRPTTARYLADGGPGQELSLALIALGLLAASALLGTRPLVLAGYALGFAAMLVAGGALHRAMHTQRTPLLVFRWFRDMRLLHQRHHVDPKVNFGIVEYGLDALLGSLVRPLRSRVEQPASRRVAG